MKRAIPILVALVAVSCGIALLSAFVVGGIALFARGLNARSAPTPTPLTASEQMDAIEAQVSALRGWQSVGPIKRNLLTSAELGAHLLAELEESYSPEEARDDALSLAALGLLAQRADFDLYGFYVELYSETVLGLYDPEADAIFVIDDAAQFDVVARATYAHEFQHALQDQLYDVEALGFSDEGWETDPERAAAVQALIEGEATLLEVHWIREHLSRDEINALVAGSGVGPNDLISRAPEWLQDDFYFPYEEGYAFVESLFDAGGWEALNAAYAQPPVSTEMILHPGKFSAYEVPQPVEAVALERVLGDGWREIDNSVLGEWSTFLVLREHVGEQSAREAAAGWGGNHYSAVYHDATGATVMASHWVWDTPQDAEEFVDGFVAYGDSRFGAPHALDASAVCWRTDVTNCLHFAAAESLWVLAPDDEILTTVVRQFDGF